jgi:outer membrane murein-binding lipoprotein Lpp
MAADLNNEKLIARYLLGDLPEAEQVAIEDRAFADQEYLALVTAVENDLIDEYVRQELSATERQQFESRFLASAERRKRVAFAKALAQVQTVPERTVVSDRAKSSWHDSLYAFISGLTPAARVAVVAVMVLLLAGGAWLLTATLQLRSQLKQLQAQSQALQNDLQQQVEVERRRNEELNAGLREEKQQREHTEESLRQLSETGNAATPPPRPVIASLILLPGLSRGGGDKSSLILAAGARLVRLQIGIDPEEPYKTFAVELRTSAGRQVWTRENLSAKTRGRARAVSLTLPASALKSGDYELRLSGRTEGGESEDVGFYYFDVKKR